LKEITSSKESTMKLCGSIYPCLVALLISVLAKADTVATIVACYACTNPDQFDPGVGGLSDGLAFEFNNLTSTAITNAVFSIGVGDDNATADSFNIGTIGANSSVFVVPGISNDGATGHSFFAYTGSVRDTSDVGPSGNGVPFSFSGIYGGTTVSSAFTPGDTYGESQDGTQFVNFLGGPDGDPCNQCFDGQVATIVTAAVTPGLTPEPSSLILLGTGAASLLGAARRRFISRG
jgi:hypothetical protein